MIMALLNVQLFSGALSMATCVNVILPDRIQTPEGGFGTKREGPLKALYLLHGMSDDQTIWCRRTSIERYAAEYNLAVIMPTTGLHWYTDEKNSQKWWTYVSRELPLLMADFFPEISEKPEHTFAAGLSMGGYGALKLGLRGGGRFSCVASLSGAVNIARGHEGARDAKGAAFFKSIFGTNEEATGSFNDLVTAAEELKEADRPKVYMWCGTEDFLYDQNILMRDHLNRLGYDLTYEESPGDHQWKYWDEKIQRVLEWLPLE
jgi:putative tributyrin esterase